MASGNCIGIPGTCYQGHVDVRGLDWNLSYFAVVALPLAHGGGCEHRKAVPAHTMSRDVWAKKKFSPHSCSLCQRAGPEVIRERNLVLSHTVANTQEIAVVSKSGELSLMAKAQVSQP